MTDREPKSGYTLAAEGSERSTRISLMGAQAIKLVRSIVEGNPVLARQLGFEQHFPHLDLADPAAISVALDEAADELDRRADFTQGAATNYRSLAAREAERHPS